jgi:hypothetical protein
MDDARLTVYSVPWDRQQVGLGRVVAKVLQGDLKVLLRRSHWDLEDQSKQVQWPIMLSVR